MVNLSFQSSNDTNIINFGSSVDNGYISINNNNSTYNIGTSNNFFYIKNTSDNNFALTYNNNILNVSNISLNNINNNNTLYFPNISTSFSSYVFNASDKIIDRDPSNVFDMRQNTFWCSASDLYNNQGSLNQLYANNANYNFGGLNIKGAWIQITLPFAVLITQITIGLLNQPNDPSIISLLGYNTNTNSWDVILPYPTNVRSTNYINQTYPTLYSFFTLIITNVAANSTNPNYSVIIPSIIIYANSIININNSIKISNANIYDINSIKLNEIILNNTSIKKYSDITDPIVSSISYQNMLTKITGAWSNINNVGFSASNITSYSFNNDNNFNYKPIANFDINGSMRFNNRILRNSINVNTANVISSPFSSSYIKVGLLNYNNAEYFKLKLYSYEYFNNNNNNNYYSQELTIYGNANNNSPIYYDSFVDNTKLTQRITGVSYIYSSANNLEFYVKFNDSFNLIKNNNGIIPDTSINNYIYVDFTNTYNTSNNFIIPTNLEFPTANNFINLTSCIKNSERIINNSCNIEKYYNNLYADNLILNTSPINNNNVLINDASGIIKASSVNVAQLQGLDNIKNSLYKIPFVNANGVIDATTVTSNQITALNTISTNYYSIPYITNQGTLQATNVSNIHLTGLSNISPYPNSFVITDNNGILKALNLPINASTFGPILTLFTSNSSVSAYTYSNLIIGSNINPDSNATLFVNGRINTNTITTSNITINGNLLSWNSSLNKLQINNTDITDDILKKVVSHPILATYSYYVMQTAGTGNRTYQIVNQLINSPPYYVSTNFNDDLNLPLHLIFLNNFDNSVGYWRSGNNFTPNGVIFNKYVDNLYLNTACGCYFTIELTEQILLLSYVLSSKYINFNNTINTINVYGYNRTLNTYEFIDTQTNLTNWNHNGSQYIINVNRTNYYTKFAFCITKTNTTSTNNYVALYSIKLNGINYSGNSTNIFNINANPITFNTNFGINNFNPSALLSVGPDLFNSPSESSVNINNGSNINGSNVRVLNLTRPSNDINTGVRASHIINNWGSATTANTRYDINLTHGNFNNENLLISMLSDGRVGFGLTPDTNLNNNLLSTYSNIYLYNTKSKYISIGVGNINNNYSIILPDSIGTINNILSIQNITNNNIKFNWVNGQDILNSLSFCKVGNQNIYTCNVDPVKFQIAGTCIIGNDNLSLGNITSSYINNNSLIVTGNIYATQDITTDSDIRYKYNFEPILNSINKIKQLQGYTFNRYDVPDNKRYCGLIAQEVIKIMPEAVVKKHDGKLRVLYTTLSGLFVEGFKELNDKLEFQNLKINLLIFFNIMLSFYFLAILHLF